jgi:hypothetical protein
MTIYQGYMGYIDYDINGTTGILRFADCSLNAKQEVITPDVMTGDWNKQAFYFGKIEVGGSIGGPFMDSFITGGGSNSLWNWATNRGTSNCPNQFESTFNVFYYCAQNSIVNYRAFGGLLCNSFTLTATAGDLVNFSMDVIGNSSSKFTSQTNTRQTTKDKVVTWEKLQVTVTPDEPDTGGGSAHTIVSDQIQNFEITIANNIEAVYNIGAGATLFPYQLLLGQREITGTITLFNAHDMNGYESYDDYTAGDNLGTVAFTLGANTYSVKCRFARLETNSNFGPVTSTLAFRAVGPQTTFDT